MAFGEVVFAHGKSPQPGWRNWQTQRTQNPPGFGPWGFDPPSRHQSKRLMLSKLVNAAGNCVKRLDRDSVTYFVTYLVIAFALL